MVSYAEIQGGFEVQVQEVNFEQKGQEVKEIKEVQVIINPGLDQKISVIGKEVEIKS